MGIIEQAQEKMAMKRKAEAFDGMQQARALDSARAEGMASMLDKINMAVAAREAQQAQQMAYTGPMRELIQNPRQTELPVPGGSTFTPAQGLAQHLGERR